MSVRTRQTRTVPAQKTKPVIPADLVPDAWVVRTGRVAVRVNRPRAKLKIGPFRVELSGWAWGLGMAVRALVAAPIYAAAAVKFSLERKRRHVLTPVWVAAATAAAAPWWVPVALVWAATGYGLTASADRLDGRGGGSGREWRLLGVGLIAGGTWMVVTSPWRTTPGESTVWWVPWLLLAAVTCGVGAPWWQGRKSRPAYLMELPEELPPIVQAWPKIAGRIPELKGEWDLDTWDDDASSGCIDLDNARADDAAKHARKVELILKAPAGSVRLRAEPGAPVNRLIVQHLEQPAGRATRIDYAVPDQTAITADGRLYLGRTADERPYHLQVSRRDGGAHVLITGATGSGKGATQRLIAAAFARDSRYWLGAMDLKRGTGIPTIRPGADIYARTPDEWRLLLEIVDDILTSRMDRYGELGRDNWTPGYDPGIVLEVDECHRVRTEQKLLTQVAKFDRIAAQGRSLGFHLLLATQRGDITSVISGELRNNVIGGGTALMHVPGDATARMLAAQDFQVDVARLPDAPGWAFPLSRLEGTGDHEPVRVPFLPSDAERDGGRDAPHGTAQDWMRQEKADAELHPDEARIAGRWGRSPAPAVDPASLVREPSATPGAGDSEGVRGEPLTRAAFLGLPAETPAPHPSPLTVEGDPLAAELEQADRPAPTAREVILGRLAEGPASRKTLVELTGTSPFYASQLLADLRARGQAEQCDDGWRLTSQGLAVVADGTLP